MLKESCILIDLSDLLAQIDPERQYPEAVIEMLFVRSVARSYSVPCVSASLLTGDPHRGDCLEGPMAHYHRLTRTLAEKAVDVLDYLPPEVTEMSDPLGLYFMLWRYTLIVGSQRAVEKQWRNLRSRSW